MIKMGWSEYKWLTVESVTKGKDGEMKYVLDSSSHLKVFAWDHRLVPSKTTNWMLATSATIKSTQPTPDPTTIAWQWIERRSDIESNPNQQRPAHSSGYYEYSVVESNHTHHHHHKEWLMIAKNGHHCILLLLFGKRRQQLFCCINKYVKSMCIGANPCTHWCAYQHIAWYMNGVD